MLSHEEQCRRIVAKVRQLQRERFYGDFLLTFNEGNVVMTRSSQTIPPEKLPQNKEG